MMDIIHRGGRLFVLVVDRFLGRPLFNSDVAALTFISIISILDVKS
jgi:hypothetical protein